MSALARLQASILVQAAESEDVASRLSTRAREFIAVGALAVVALMTANPAHAQNRILTSSNCAVAGEAVGRALGGDQNNQVRHVVGGTLGALFGAAVGGAACDQRQPARDSSYSQGPSYNNGVQVLQRPSVAVGPQGVKVALSYSEREHLDGLATGAIDAKYAWKKALWEIDQAQMRGNQAGVIAGMEREAAARVDFNGKRMTLARTVALLHNGAEGMEPRAVGRYLEISSALMELSTEAKVSYQSLLARDNMLQARSQAYAEAANQAAATRETRAQASGPYPAPKL